MTTASSFSQIPSPFETLLLRAALLDGEPALDGYRRWKAAVDVDGLDGGSQRMLPLLADNLARLGVEDELTPALHGHRRHAFAANAKTVRVTMTGLKALREAGIEVLVLKGTALIAGGLCELGLRPIGDIDLLVRSDDRERAIDALVGAGWETSAFPEWYVKRTLARDWPAWVLRRDRVEIDLHWSALHLVRDPAAEAPLWERATKAALGSEPVLVPSIEDQALHAWLHAAEHNPVPPLRWAADAVSVVRASEGFDWDYCVQAAIAQRVTVQSHAALDYLARELDLPVPPTVLDRLRRADRSRVERREHIARNRDPQRRGKADRALLALQDHRRQRIELLDRSLVAGALDLRRSRRARREQLAQLELHDLRDAALELNRDHDPLDSLLYGWSFPEADGRWTDGREAGLAVALDPDRPATVVAKVSGFAGPPDRTQRVEIWTSRGRQAVLRFTGADFTARDVEIPVLPSPEGKALLRFVIRSPRSPSDLGLDPPDDRQLGLLLRRLTLA